MLILIQILVLNSIPILMLILPFFIIKFHRKSITIGEYINTLIAILKYHVVGKVLSEFNNVGWDRRVFMLMSVVFYFINISYFGGRRVGRALPYGVPQICNAALPYCL